MLVEVTNADGQRFNFETRAPAGRQLTVEVAAIVRGAMMPVAEYYLETLLSRPRDTGLILIDGPAPLTVEAEAMDVVVDFLARSSEFMLAQIG